MHVCYMPMCTCARARTASPAQPAAEPGSRYPLVLGGRRYGLAAMSRPACGQFTN